MFKKKNKIEQEIRGRLKWTNLYTSGVNWTKDFGKEQCYMILTDEPRPPYHYEVMIVVSDEVLFNGQFSRFTFRNSPIRPESTVDVIAEDIEKIVDYDEEMGFKNYILQILVHQNRFQSC